MKKEITLQDVFLFITENCDDTNAMDKINKMTFPFTSSYTNRKKQSKLIFHDGNKIKEWNDDYDQLIEK